MWADGGLNRTNAAERARDPGAASLEADTATYSVLVR